MKIPEYDMRRCGKKGWKKNLHSFTKQLRREEEDAEKKKRGK